MVITQAVLMAGGKGSRMWPIAGNKHLIPIYDKPMIYYSLGLLMSLGVHTVYLVCDPDSRNAYQRMFGAGGELGLRIRYISQPEPEGVAQGLILCRKKLERSGRPFYLMLGDNVFHGHGLVKEVLDAIPEEAYFGKFPNNLGVIFAKEVKDPGRYGVVTFDRNGDPVNLVEKPSEHISDWAITGLYAYHTNALHWLDGMSTSERGEYEITTFNQRIADAGALKVKRLGRGIAWLDTGTPEGLHEAAAYVAALQQRQGQVIYCLEEIARRQGFLDKTDAISAAERIDGNSDYGKYARSALWKDET